MSPNSCCTWASESVVFSGLTSAVIGRKASPIVVPGHGALPKAVLSSVWRSASIGLSGSALATRSPVPGLTLLSAACVGSSFGLSLGSGSSVLSRNSVNRAVSGDCGLDSSCSTLWPRLIESKSTTRTPPMALCQVSI